MTTQFDIELVSFGYLHGQPPAAHLTIDLREHFRDPHVSPELRYMTADDAPVRVAVMNTPGVPELVTATACAVAAFRSGPSAGPVVVADGCASGRHRAPVFADHLAVHLAAIGLIVRVQHHDLAKSVVEH